MSKIVVGTNSNPAIAPQSSDCGLRNTTASAASASRNQLGVARAGRLGRTQGRIAAMASAADPIPAHTTFHATPRAIMGPMSKYLPNNVKVVPKNVPGAGGRRGYAELARAKPDGYTICVINFPGAAIPSLTGEEVAYDINQFVWVARMSNSAYVIASSGKNEAIDPAASYCCT